MIHSLHVLQVTLLFALSSYSFDLGGHDDWTWPGSTFDGLAVGYGFPGWELPPPLPVVHNHFHQYPPHDHDLHHDYHDHDPHHHYYGHDSHHYGHGPHHDFPRFGGGYGYSHGYGYGHGYDHSPSPYRDYLCHHAKKMKHVRKWLVKMLSCSLFF